MQTIQFSIGTHFNSICPIYRTLSGATTLDQSEPGSDGNEGILCIPQSSSITEASLSDCLVSYPGHLLWESLTPVQRFSWYILQLEPTGPQDSCYGRVLSIYRDPINVFCSPNRLGHMTLVMGESYPCVEIQLVYSAALADWATGHLPWKSLIPLQRSSRCILQPLPADWAKFHRSELRSEFEIQSC